MLNCHWWLPVLNDPDGPAGELAGRFALAPVPGGSGILGVWLWAIPRAAEARAAAWRFISFIASAAEDRARVAAGSAPVRVSTLADPTLGEVGGGPAYRRAVAAILAGGRPLVEGREAEAAIGAIGEHVHAAVTGRLGVDAAIAGAAAAVDAVLER
jgi:ABC-type glycerol-3-phosphate transport system substrate-binding protein